MQKYIAYQVMKHGKFANFADPGAGKTLSAILTAMLNENSDTTTNGHNILVIGANSTIQNEEEWISAINSFDTKANVLHKLDHNSQELKNMDRDKEKNNYFLYNYESFQGDKSEKLVKNLREKNFDTIILDEAHLIKDDSSKRHDQILALLETEREKNKNLKTVIMTATPIINDLDEGLEIMKTLHGYSNKNIKTKPITAENILAVHRYLSEYGMFLKKYPKELEIKEIPIILKVNNLEDLKHINKISEAAQKKDHHTLSQLEKAQMPSKLSMLNSLDIKPGTIIYTEYVTDIVADIKKSVEESTGLKVGFYTGKDKSGYPGFKNRLDKSYPDDEKVDILIASSAAAEGINLQDVANEMIVMIPPFTDAKTKQVIGRIYRQGQENEVKVKILVLYIEDDNGNLISLDKEKLNAAQKKGDLANLVKWANVHEYGELINQDALIAKTREACEEWEGQVLSEVDTEDLFAESLNPELIIDKKRSYSFPRDQENQAYQQHKMLSTLDANKAFQYYQENPKERDKLQLIYDKLEQVWKSEGTPRNVLANKIVSKINNTDTALIGDFGCGKFQLADTIKEACPKAQVIGFDYVSMNPENKDIIECNMGNIPKDKAKNNSLDFAVFSLSMGDTYRHRNKEATKSFLNIPSYLKEASRLLKPKGELMISVPAQAWSKKEKLNAFLKEIQKQGFEIQLTGKNKKPVRKINGSDKFLYIFAKKIS